MRLTRPIVTTLLLLTFGAALRAEPPDAWRFNGPFGVAVDSRGVVHVAEIQHRRIARFTLDGRWLEPITNVEGYGELRGPFGVCIGDDDTLYIADTLNHSVIALDPDGKPRFILGTGEKSSRPGEFSQPHFLAVNRAGELFVADTFNARIQKFAPDGAFLTAWGRVGDGPGEFLHKGYLGRIDVDNAGFVYVREFDGGRIQKYTENGEYVATFSRRGAAPGQLDEGYGLTVIGDRLYCPDTFESRVQIFSLDGELIGVWSPGEGNTGERFNHPVDIAATADGSLILSDWKNNRVLRMSDDGRFLAFFGQTLDDLLRYEPPARVERPGRGPVRIGIYAGIDDGTLEKAREHGVSIIYTSLNGQYRDWGIATQVEKARSMGIEVHPSIACLPFGQSSDGNSAVFAEHPAWGLWKRGATEPMATLLSWAHPEARTLRADHLAKQVEKTGVPGLMLDYIRYLGTDYGYDPVIVDGFFKKHGKNPLQLPQDDPAWMQYRADFITDFIVELRHTLATRLPQRHVDVSVFLSDDLTADPASGVYLTSSLQDWKTWAAMGIVDTVHVAYYTRDFDTIYRAVRRVRETVPDRVRVNAYIACYGGNLNTPELLRKGFEAAIAGGADIVTVYRSDAIYELDLFPVIGEIARELEP